MPNIVPNIVIEISRDRSVSESPVEIVERKGLGHPDYICDASLEAASIALSKEYLKKTGRVLHYNLDKGLLVAGQADKGFGYGRIVEPMELIIGDRATYSFGKVKLPVEAIVKDAVRAWFKANLPLVDVKRHLKIRVALEPGSAALKGIFSEADAIMGANDTSAVVGSAPMTTTETAVYGMERLINSADFKARFPETGADVKVMGVRTADALDITVACPFFARLIKNEGEYFRKKAEALAAMRAFAKKLPFKRVSIGINTLDKRGQGAQGVYLTVIGTSAEDADSGQVGRGNRVSGVISLNRPSGAEAAAGKNPVSHVGKIYALLAHRMAHEARASISGIAEIDIWLVSKIGAPINRPHRIYVKIHPSEQGRSKVRQAAVKEQITRLIARRLSRIGAFTSELMSGVYPIC
ncbi:MAG: methionine adenosyltransferase [Deltaproteobacteria bacterium]|nr:methionine adenosyltransferase [Deltaproteobacteria bacterium]